VNVADDVERAGLALEVVPERLSHKRGGVALARRVQPEDVTEAFALKVSGITTHRDALVADDVWAELAVGPCEVALTADVLGRIHDDGDRQGVELAGKGDQWLAVFAPDVGGIDDRKQAAGEPLARDGVEDIERVACRFLRVLIVRDPAAAGVRGKYLGGLEEPARERGLAGAGGADQDDEGEFGDFDLNRHA
jgi:hypothetical protein